MHNIKRRELEEVRVTKRSERFFCNCSNRSTCGACGVLHTTNMHDGSEKLRLRALHNLMKDAGMKLPTQAENKKKKR